MPHQIKASIDRKISIVIPVYNSQGALKACLDSVFKLSYSDFDVIVVDDGSADKSVAVAQEYPCRIIRLDENRGAAVARDRGVAAATGEIIAFLDADCIAPEDWLHKISLRMTPDIIGVGGRYDLPKGCDLLSKLFLTIWDPINVLYNAPRIIKFCLGGNCAFWKSVLMKKRAKKELRYCRRSGGDDTIMCSELKQYGKIFYDPDISVIHNKACSFVSIFKKSVQAGYTGAMVSRVCGRLLMTESYRLYKFILYMASLALLLVTLSNKMRLSGLFLASMALYCLIQLPLVVGAYRRLSLRFSLFLIPLAEFVVNILYLLGQGKRIFCSLGSLFKVVLWRARFVINIIDPRAVSKLFFFVTRECNARCGFCFNEADAAIYKQGSDLGLEEITLLTAKAGFLPNVTITGGEPFLRKDIYEICDLFYTRAGTRIFTIVTNGICSDYIADVIDKFLSRSGDISMTILVALDGVGENHDRIKGVEACYEHAALTLGRMHGLKLRYPNLTVGINTMLTDGNAAAIEQTLASFNKNFSYDRQALNLPREPARTSQAPDSISIEKYFDLTKISNAGLIKTASFVRQRFNNVFIERCQERSLCEFKMKRSIKTCLAGKKFFVINNSGDVFPCEMLLKSLGNIRDNGYEFLKIVRGRPARDMRSWIREARCYCQWPCAVVNNTLFDSRSYVFLLKDMILKRSSTQYST